ncbi:sterol desaturase family protein [Halovulum sp. GXIMD14794]
MDDWLWTGVRAVYEPFTDLRNRLSYIYLGTALLVACAVYIQAQIRAGSARIAGLTRWLLPKDILLHPSAQADYAYYVVNKFMHGAFYGSAILGSHITYDMLMPVLERNFGPSPTGVEPSVLGTVVVTLLIVMATDAALWLGHYLFHKIPILWEFHKVHHSAEVMTPITAARMHPVEEIFDATLAAIVLGATVATIDYIMGDGMRVLSLLDLNIVTALFFLAAFNLRHSHVWVRYPTWLQHILVCPAQHQIHHSRARKHWDKNMGFIFAFWDWGAGTLYAPREKEEITFGLGTEEDGTWRSVKTLYFRPFVGAWKLLPKPWRRPAGDPQPD